MQLEKLYRHRFEEADLPAKKAIWGVLCRHFFARYIHPTDTVVDIGAGYCEFLNQIEARRRIAVDQNPRTAEFAAPGVEIVTERCDGLQSLPDGVANLVFMSNFLEHLPSKDAVLGTLTEAHRLLCSGGRLMILQPNVRLLPGAYWDFFDHHTPLTERSLVEAGGMLDFEVERVIARFLPYTTKSLLPQSPWLVRVYLLLPPLWWLLGKQSFILLRKR